MTECSKCVMKETCRLVCMDYYPKKETILHHTIILPDKECANCGNSKIEYGLVSLMTKCDGVTLCSHDVCSKWKEKTK